MTIQGAIAELKNLLEDDDIPFYYKAAIKKVIETVQMEMVDSTTEPQKKCHRDEEYACHLYPNEDTCNNCKLWYEDKSQTERHLPDYNYEAEETEMERLERIDNELEDAWARIRELTDEPQTERSSE